jgi:EpsI family protein
MIALLALSVVYAHLAGSRLRAGLCLALALPIAIFANIVRILLLCALELRGLATDPDGFLHQAVGLSVYAVAIVALQVVGAPGGAEAAAPVAAPALVRPPLALRRRGLAAALLVLLAATAAAALPLSMTTADFPPTSRTRAIPADLAGWTGTDARLERRVLEILGTDDVLFRRYARADMAGEVDLYVVHSADSRRVAHVPDICFNGDGFTPIEADDAPLPVGSREITAERRLFARGDALLLVYFWYRLDGVDEWSYLRHEWRAVWHQFRRAPAEGSLLRVSVAVGPGGVAEAEARVARFGRDVLPSVIAAVE